MSGGRPRFSVIVPALNEADEIEETLRRAAAALGDAAELIVVDGGSLDATPGIARPLARVLRAGPNRGAQQRLGADRSAGDILVFLHADTWLPANAGEAISKAVAEGARAGCFGFGLRGARDPAFGLLVRGINWRTRALRTATGDQAIFATRAAYEATGGMPPIPLFEDVRLVAALKRVGRFQPLSEVVRTSPRRWRRRGLARTVAHHWLLRTLHALGADPVWLARRYR